MHCKFQGRIMLGSSAHVVVVVELQSLGDSGCLEMRHHTGTGPQPTPGVPGSTPAPSASQQKPEGRGPSPTRLEKHMNNLAYSGKAGSRPGRCPAVLCAEPPRPRTRHRTGAPAASHPVGAARRGRFGDAKGNSAPPSQPFTPRSPPRAWRCHSSPGRTGSCLAEV